MARGIICDKVARFKRSRASCLVLYLMMAWGYLGVSFGHASGEHFGNEKFDFSEAQVSCPGHCLLMVWAYLGAGFGIMPRNIILELIFLI